MDPKVAQEATAAIVELARRQYGVVALAQLREDGLTRDQVRVRLRAGWLVRLHRGVYAVRGHALSWRGHWLAAVLAAGEDALLSHVSAAALWRMTTPRKGPIDITVGCRSGRTKRAGIKLHRSASLMDGDRDRRDAIPVTSPTRTIIDLARSGVSGRPLERLLDEAEYLGLLSSTAFVAGVRPGGRPIPPALRAVVEDRQPGSAPTRSELEERFLALCKKRGVPVPLVNAELLGLTVDFLWSAAALVVEVDGRASHDTARGFQEDRDRDGMLVAAGFKVLRFTWRDVTGRPGVVADRVGRVLG